MQSQWYLCLIESYPYNEGERLKPHDNLSVRYPDDFFGEDEWCVWLPIIPRVGDTLQFNSWQVQVSRVILHADTRSETGIKEGIFVSARISIRDAIIPDLLDSQFSIETTNNNFIHKWENYARRGNDLEYYAWELRHENFLMPGEKEKYYSWHTRVRPVAGDIIRVNDDLWRVNSVILASADRVVDGSLVLNYSTPTV